MSEVIVVDEIVGTNAYINGELQPKKEGAIYVVEAEPMPESPRECPEI